jgi:hypothetical protein
MDTAQSQLNNESEPFVLFEAHEQVRPGVVRKRTLRFDFNALADFEQEMGMGFAQMMQNRATFGTARALLWSGLKHEDRSLTIEKVGELMGKCIKAGEADVTKFLEITLTACKNQGALGNVTVAELAEGPPTLDQPPTVKVINSPVSRGTQGDSPIDIATN